jgi:flagellar basal-body rod modification protein FlgD
MIDPVGSSSAAPVAPSTPSSVMGAGGKMGKDEFMKMLVAQLKNQDPLNPMQGQDLAVQLAQFSSVEQLMNINQTLQGQSGSESTVIQALNSTAAIGAIGKNAIAIGNSVNIPAKDPGSTTVTASIGGAGGPATLHLFDASGKEVGTRELGIVESGKQTFALGDAAKDLAPGVYTYSIDAKDFQGKPVDVQTFISGRIDGVRYGKDGPVFTMGGITIPLGSIVEIGAGN